MIPCKMHNFLILITFLLYRVYCVDETTNDNLMKYLESKSKVLDEELIRHSRNQENLYEVKLNYTNIIELYGNFSNGEIFTIFNISYVLLDQDLYEISQNNSNLVYHFPFSEKITLLKTKEFQNLGIILLATHFDLLHIYGFSNTLKKFFKIQNIAHLNVSDAELFENQNYLYLVITSSMSEQHRTITFYKFVDSHFDELERVSTAGATKLCTFPSEDKEIIIVLQDHKSTSSIFEFQNEKIRKILKIRTKNPKEITTYTYKGSRYVAIYDVKFKLNLYLWAGLDLTIFDEFRAEFTLEKQKILYLNNNPYLTGLNSGKMAMFSLHKISLIENFLVNGNITKILDYQVLPLGKIVILSKFQIITLSINITTNFLDKSIIEEEKLSECVLNLEKSLYVFRNKLSTLTSRTENIVKESIEDLKITPNFENLTIKFEDFKSKVQNFLIQNGTKIVEKTSTFQFIKADQVEAKNIQFESINNIKWEPKKWLSYSKPQTIEGSVKIDRLDVIQFNPIPNETSIFKDLLLAKGNQDLSGSVTVTHCNASEIETNLINNIPVERIYYKNNSSRITGRKFFQDLNIINGQIDTINGKGNQEVLSHLDGAQKTYKTNLTIDNLIVETINGIHFDELKNSVFRVGLTDTIEGNITFNNLKAKNITFNTLARKSNFFTISTDQMINASGTITKIFADNINTNTVNNMDFKNSVVTFNNPIIDSRVKIDNLKVVNNVEYNGSGKFFSRSNKTHIVGTDELDFLQRYNGKVTLKGNLFLKNLDMQEFAKVMISGKDFDRNFARFWSKTREQDIPTHFEAKNGVSTPHLFSTFINNIFVNDFMTNSMKQQKHTKYYFDNVKILKNVVLNPEEQHSPDFLKIQKESVKIDGGTFTIKGHKIYTDDLKIDKLEVNYLNNLAVTDSLSGFDSQTRQNHFENLLIKGDLNCKNLSLELLNDINLNWLVSNSYYIDEEHEIGEVHFKNVTAKNLYLKQLNGINMNEFIRKIDQIRELDHIKNVYITVNVTLKNVANLTSINNIETKTLLHLNKYQNHTIYGGIKFLGNVIVKDLHVSTVNNIDLPTLTKRFLYKSWNQNISQPYKFTTLKSDNLITKNINEHNVSTIIDVTKAYPQEIFVPNGLKFTQLTTIKGLSANAKCDIGEVLKNLRNPPAQYWGNVEVKGNVTFWDKEATISKVFDDTILNQGGNIIRKKIKFTQHLCAKNMNALKKLNNIDINEIIDDAFINDPEVEQTITGKKTFIRLEGENAVIHQNADIPKINNINLTEINDKIVNKNSVENVRLRGKKVFFNGLEVKHFETDLVAGVNPNNLVSFTNKKPIPRGVFESLTILNNINIKFINKMPFEEFLSQRLLKNSPNKQIVNAKYFFSDVEINGNMSTSHINEIAVDDIVFDEGTQNIGSWKTFTNNLKIIGNVQVDLMNGLKLSQIYEQAALINENTIFNGSLKIMGPAMINGNIHTKYINNYPVEYMMDTSAKESLSSEAGQIQKIITAISNFVEKYLNATIRMPTEYMYMEKSTDVQIIVPNSKGAQVAQTKDEVLIHIESEEQGDFCDLPPSCKCPVQQTMHLSSEHSINSFMNKGTQRIYSYFDEEINAHLITNSISVNSYCRRNTTKVINEISSLTWNTIPRFNTSGAFFMHRIFFHGYIIGVQFFTFYSKTYVVIGFYYDPVLNTHNVNTVVLRFNEDKTDLEEIQKIPANGLKAMAIIQTAQGVLLVMGNTIQAQFSGVNTKILRFNAKKQQFDLLRIVPSFGAEIAVGVVLQTESLIVLANEGASVLILKYSSEFDNYYFYQSFRTTSTISSMLVYYAEGFGISDAYLNIVTKYNKYYIYTFKFIQGWVLKSTGELNGIKSLIPFRLNEKKYLFASSSEMSCLLTLVEHDSN